MVWKPIVFLTLLCRNFPKSVVLLTRVNQHYVMTNNLHENIAKITGRTTSLLEHKVGSLFVEIISLNS